MAKLNEKGFIDDGTNSLNVQGTLTTGGGFLSPGSGLSSPAAPKTLVSGQGAEILRIDLAATPTRSLTGWIFYTLSATDDNGVAIVSAGLMFPVLFLSGSDVVAQQNFIEVGNVITSAPWVNMQLSGSWVLSGTVATLVLTGSTNLTASNSNFTFSSTFLVANNSSFEWL